MHPDRSCHHAVLATAMARLGVRAPSAAFVLGATATTRARLVDGAPVFGALYPELAALLARFGLTWTRHDVRAPGSWARAKAHMARGADIAVLTDPYYLPFWHDHKRHHGVHVVLVHDPSGSTIGAVDATSPNTFEGRMPLDDLEAALFATERDQQWYALTVDHVVEPSADLTVRDLRTCHAELVGTDGPGMSAVQLVAHLGGDLADVMTVMRRMSGPDPRFAPDPARRKALRIIRGLANWHHTVRWFGLYLACVEGVPAATPAAAAELAASAARLRDLLIKSGVVAARRRADVRAAIEEELDRLADGSATIAADLEAAISART